MEIDPTPAPGRAGGPSAATAAQTDRRAAQLMKVAQSLEAQFLAEMLKSAGVGQTPKVFGGGAGEDQFASFLRDEQAKQMAQAGGIGLAQALYDSMMAQSNE